MLKEEKNMRQDVEVKKEILYESVFIQLNM